MKDKRFEIAVISVLLLTLMSGMAACGSASAPTADGGAGKLQVTASFYPLYYFARVIGGDKADVRNLTPAGAEPHDYEPTTRDIARIESGDLLILNGSLEAWAQRIQDQLQGKKVIVVTAGAGLFTNQSVEEGASVPDPHVWLSPVLAKIEAARIAAGFTQADPNNASYYATNAQDLENKLGELDAAFKNGLAQCRQKDLITSHAAFGYLAQAYGLHQVSISGLSPDAEPSAQQLAAIATFAKANHVQYIFFESLVSPKLAETIANEVGAKTLVLNPLEGLTDEEMQQGKNYFTVMQDNLSNLELALECAK